VAHPPLQPRRRLREAGPGDQAPDPRGGEARLTRSAPNRIELRLRSLAQLFHSFDPSPFNERELDATASEFIAGWASDIPKKLEPELVIHLEEVRSEPPEQLNATVADAVHNHYRDKAETKRREYRDMMRRGRISLIVGLMFYTVCFLAGQALIQFSESPLAQLGRDSLLIGGWVAMWRPLEIFLYDSWDLRRKERDYLRLSRMAVRIECPRS
jgi:hypothetical protein